MEDGKRITAGRLIGVLAALAAAQGAFAAISAKTDGEKAVTLTGEEIAALPRKNAALRLPAEGMYLSSGWYGASGGLAWSGGLTNTEWSPDHPRMEEGPSALKTANQGNAVQTWRHGTNLVRTAEVAGKAGMSLMTLCSGASAQQVAAVYAASDFVAYDMHESFTFELYDDEMNMYKETAEETLRRYTLRKSANDLVRKIRGRTDRLHELGWKALTSSSASFHLDYLMLGGLDVPGLEFYPFADTLLGAALCRGMTRQYGANGWHAYLAHEWYSYLPHTNPRKMESLRTMLQMQYLNGAKIITLESGNLYLQSNLCVDSPQGFLPPVGERIINGNFDREQDKLVTADDIREAKRKYSWIDDRSPVVQKYRRIMGDFWDFVKANPQPAGQPEATVALVKGNFDLGGELANANTPIAGAYNIAKIDHHWMSGEPERSWHVATDVFFPKPATLLPNRNLVYGATPYGLMDIVSFAFDNVTAEYLVRNYKLLILTGWNTCSPKQYKVLCDYVKGGGKLCLSIAHLSTNERRNYDFFTKDELVNGGDFSELCGIKVTGQGDRFYWATGTSRAKNCLGLVARRRYGIMGMPLGKIEYTQPEENYETLAADDEQFRPVIVRAKRGKGEVYFLNLWSYPAEANRDTGTGATEGSLGLVGELYAYLAQTSRGNVWITGPDFERPDADCGYIAYSYFPSAGKIFLLNLDYEHERKCVMHWFGEKDFLTLKPAEFRVIDAPKLDPGEQLNNRSCAELSRFELRSVGGL